ncbi:MAG: transposase [Proteobacteria bacterium]|nr:transposase [Pseudomonadota bacterium]
MASQLRASGQLNIDESDDIGTGAISFVQFFNSALKLSPHLHIIFLDGGFTRAGGGGFDFIPYSGFYSELMFDILHGIINRLELVFKEFGYVRDDGEGVETELEGDIPLPFKPRAPKSYRRNNKSKDSRIFPDPNKLTVKDWCNVHYKHFSLHAGVAIQGSDRFGLRKMIRYTARSAVSPSSSS